MSLALATATAAAGVLFGWGAVRATFARRPADRREAVLRAFLSAAFGLAGLSAGYSALSIAGLGHVAAAWWSATALAGIGLVLSIAGATSPQPIAARDDRIPKGLVALFAVGMAVFAAAILEHSIDKPEGGWDAWMIWNLRARLIHGAPRLQDAFPPESIGTHPDYPLMVPAAVSLGWTVLGATPDWLPMILSIGIVLLCAGMLGAAVAHFRGIGFGLMAALVFIATPKVAFIATAKEADGAVALFVLAGAIAALFALERQGRARAGLLALAGAALSMAGWSKNEGSLFLAVTAAALLLDGRSRWPRKIADVGFLALGALPGLVLLAAFKLKLAPTNDLLVEGWRAKLLRPLSLRRWLLLAWLLFRRLFFFQMWGLFLLPAPFLWIWGRRASIRPASRPLWNALGLAALGFVGVYLLTPHDLAWHVKHSVDRLIIQCWPTFLLLLFVSMPVRAEDTADAPRGEGSA